MAKNTKQRNHNITKKLYQNFKYIMNYTRLKRPWTVQIRPPCKTFMRNGITIRLADKALEAYKEIIDTLLGEKWINNNFSRKYLETHIVQEFITKKRKAYKSSSFDLSTEIQKIIADLKNFSAKQTVIIPIDGLKFQLKRRLKIGSVIIKCLSKNDVYYKRLNWIINSSKDIQLPLLDKVAAIVEERGEPIKAEEKAFLSLEKVLNLLRFYIPMFYHRSYRIKIRSSGKYQSTIQRCIVLESTGTRFTSTESIEGALYSFELDKFRFNKMNKAGFREFKELLFKVSLNEFKQKLVLALEWFGNAVDIDNEPLKFLNYTMVLEILLSKEEKDSDRSITDKIAEGGAFLLSRDLNRRKEIKKDIKNFYSIRSKIVHSGKNRVKLQDLKDIEFIAANLILVLLKKKDKFRNTENLLNWFNDQRLK